MKRNDGKIRQKFEGNAAKACMSLNFECNGTYTYQVSFGLIVIHHTPQLERTEVIIFIAWI